MSQGQHSQVDGDERYSTLLNNSNAVRAVTSAVEGTLGPKGLDVMLVGPCGEVVITNDGVTILDKMDVTHPARLLIQVARAQEEKIGDGTTTATVQAHLCRKGFPHHPRSACIQGGGGVASRNREVDGAFNQAGSADRRIG